MTEKPNMYHKGKIYKIVNDINDDIYIGSTVKQLSNRMGGHRSSARFNPDRKIYITMNLLGIEHFKIILIEEYKCENKEQLRAREDYYIKLLKPALNMIGAIFNVEQHKDNIKEYRKEYAKNHIQDKKEYNERNKQHNSETCKKYRELHKQEIRDKHLSKIEHCDLCDVDILKANMKKHVLRKTHQDNLINKEIMRAQ